MPLPRQAPNPAPLSSFQTSWQRAYARVNSDFRLLIISFFALCGILGITPFAILRFMQGQWLIGIVDLLLVVGIAFTTAYAWVTGRSDRTATVVALCNTVGCIAIILLAGRVGLYWSYLVLLANFLLMTDRRLGIATAIALVAAGLSQSHLFVSTAEMLSFATTSLLCSAFALVFANRSEIQQSRLEHLSQRDPLTGVGNRRLMELELDLATSGEQGSTERLAMAVIDIDHFKQVNDRFGHEAGDVVLRMLTDVVEANIRKRDRVYRFGGEEFVLLLVDIDFGSLRSTLEKVREAVADELKSPAGQVTVSIGGAQREAGEDWRNWLSRADAALFHAKQAGRNRVRLDGEVGRGLSPGLDRRSA